MNDFGVCLDYRHLQHLILSDKAGYEALQSVALFLFNNMNDNSVFNLSQQKPTFDLAEKYAGQHLMNAWQEEKSDAEVRVDNHWKEVLRRKDLASKLRAELKHLKSELDTAERNYESARVELISEDSRFNRKHNYYSVIRPLIDKKASCIRIVDSLERQVRNKKYEIECKS